jgi:benzoate membrane transport protein
VAAGASGAFARVMDRIPQALAAALLAGVLARFAFDAFLSLQRELTLVGAMFAAYLLGRPPLVAALRGAGGAGAGRGDRRGARAVARWPASTGRWAAPVFTLPRFSLAATIGMALPLFVVTMASQNLPGVAAQRAAGYDTPVSPVITTTGVASCCWRPSAATR